jgi:hypothetical protein
MSDKIFELLTQVEGDAKVLVIVWMSLWFLKHLVTSGLILGIGFILTRTIVKLVNHFSFAGEIKAVTKLPCDYEGILLRRSKTKILEYLAKGKEKGEL